MNFLIYLKNVMMVIVIVHVIAILKKIIEFCEEDSIIF